MKRKLIFFVSSVALVLGGVLAPSAVLAPIAKADTASVCPDGSHLSSGLCIADTSSAVPLTQSSVESCPTPLTGQTATLNATTHQCAMSQVSVPATAGASYSCPSGGLLGGTAGAWGSSTTTCYVNAVVLNAVSTSGYSCPGGGVPTASSTPGVFDTCVTDSTASSYLNTNLIVAYNCSVGTPALISGVHKCVTSGAVYGAPPTVVTTPVCPVNTSLVGGLCQSFGITSYPATPVAIYVCPSGGNLSGTLCIVGAYATIYNATQVGVNYTCPSGGQPSADLIQLCQTTGALTQIAPSYNTVATCATGTITADHTGCVTTAQTVTNASTSTAYGPCGSPAINADPYCVTYSHSVVSATYSTTYSCPSGTPSGSGYSMLCTTAVASSYGASSNSYADTSGFTGGTYGSSGNYYYRTFTTSGTLGGITSASPSSVDIFAVGGGGGGGNSTGNGAGAGAGGGQVINYVSFAISGSSYVVTVGSGGGAQSDGGSSSVGTLAIAHGGYAGYEGSVGGQAGGVGGGNGGGAQAYPNNGLNGQAGTSGYGGGGGSGNNGGSSGGSGVDGGASGGTANFANGFSAVVNHGGGGGGATGFSGSVGGSGGSGLVIIRWLGSYVATYYCPSGTPSGVGSAMVCVTTGSSSVASVVTYSGTCATGFTMNTTSGYCDSVAVTLGVPLIPKGSFYCVQNLTGVSFPIYSVLPYDGSAVGYQSTIKCSLVPPIGFAIPIPAGSNVVGSTYICELYTVDPVTGVDNTFDYPSTVDDTGNGPSGNGYLTCVPQYVPVLTVPLPSDATDPAGTTSGGTGDPLDGSGSSDGLIVVDLGSCYSMYSMDIIGYVQCLQGLYS